MVVVFGLLAARVAQLQIFSGDKYQRLAVEQALRTIPLSAERGSIFDRSGRDLAMSIQRTTIYADPTLVVDPAGEAAKLAPIVHVAEATLLARLSDKGTAEQPRRFAYIARTVPDNVAQAVNQLQLPGIGFVPEASRSYPAGAVAGSVVGQVGTDGTGLDGIEYLDNSLLTGRPGELVVQQDPKGHDIPNTQRTRVAAQRGTDVVLSLDEDMQWEAEYSLLDQVKATGANGGMAVVLDVDSGDVLAMASVVGSTATSPARVAAPGDHNAPLTDLFEPGSTNKLVTISWALEHGFVAPDTEFSVPYSIRVNPAVQPYYDAEQHLGVAGGIEHWTTADIIRHSSNVGTIEIAQRMHNQDMADALHAFGLGTKTSIAWPGQPNGLLIPPSQYYATGKYSSAIGYGVAVTGMQMLDAFTTIANGGVSRPPRLIDATIDAQGKRHNSPEQSGSRVVSPNTASTMTRMLEGVVAAGTGACAAIPGYTVAGKTGTAKKALPTGGYTSGATMASFIGFAPAEHPRFAALVVLDERNLSYGGTVSAPVFSEIMHYALTQYSVPQTDPAGMQYNQAKVTAQDAGNSCVVPHGQALTNVLNEQAAAASAHSGATSGNMAGTSRTSSGSTASLPPKPTKHP